MSLVSDMMSGNVTRLTAPMIPKAVCLPVSSDTDISYTCNMHVCTDRKGLKVIHNASLRGSPTYYLKSYTVKHEFFASILISLWTANSENKIQQICIFK